MFLYFHCTISVFISYIQTSLMNLHDVSFIACIEATLYGNFPSSHFVQNLLVNILDNQSRDLSSIPGLARPVCSRFFFQVNFALYSNLVTFLLFFYSVYFIHHYLLLLTVTTVFIQDVTLIRVLTEEVISTMLLHSRILSTPLFGNDNFIVNKMLKLEKQSIQKTCFSGSIL